MINGVTVSFRIGRILADRPFAEVSEPAVAVADETRGVLAVAGTYVHEPDTLAPVIGVYDTADLTCRAVARARYPVHALALHPTLPLLVAGTGQYDGGYFFRGQLLRLDWETGVATSLLDEPDAREVLGLEWLNDRDLRVLLAPPDDWEDREARVEGHVAVLSRSDWRAVPEASITCADLAGPRVAAPRPDGRAEAVRLVAALSPGAEPRRHVRAVEELPDGRVLTTLDGVALEAWQPTGERQWTVPDAKGGQDLVVEPDGQSAWVGLVRPEWEDRPRSVVRLSLAGGEQIEQFSPAEPVSVVGRADGRMALAPAGTNGRRSRLRIRRGSRVSFRGRAGAEVFGSSARCRGGCRTVSRWRSLCVAGPTRRSGSSFPS